MLTTRPARLRYLENPDDNPGGGKALTQEEVNALIGQRVAEAARAAKREAEQALTAKLGGKTLEEVLAAAQAAEEAEKARMSEAERIKAEAEQVKAEAEAARAAAKAELHTTRVRAALLAAGAPEAGLDAIHLPDLTVDSTPEDIKTAVDALKAKLPGLFTGKAQAPGDPGKPPAPVDHPGEFGAGGLSEFEKRFGKPA
jgi:uncharacterized membrane protein YqiK